MSEGKQIDWSKAPEGATHYCHETDDYMAAWFKLERGEWYFCLAVSPKKWALFCEEFPGQMTITELQYQAPSWSGEGLPPVGTVCEIHGTAGQELRDEEFSWRQVEIIAHTNFGGGDVSVGRDLECATLGWGIASKFRPIRTAEQIAAEERYAAINQMIGFVKDHPGGRHGVPHLAQLSIQEEACRDLYDAGYRLAKVEA